MNKVYPGEFNYGGGHVLQDLVEGKKIHLKATAYGTSCYPNRLTEMDALVAYLQVLGTMVDVNSASAQEALDEEKGR